MLVICNNYINSVRFKKHGKFNPYHDFNFHLNLKFGIRNDNKHKRFCYFGESFKRFDKKVNKISYHEFKRNLNK